MELAFELTLGVVVAFSLGVSLSWLFFQRLQRESKDSSEQEPASYEYERKGENDQADAIAAGFSALIDRIRYEGKANRGEERREDSGKAFREKITIGLIVATLIAIGWQVREMIRVYEPIREQAEASNKAANAAAASQRAWVGPLSATVNSGIQKDKGITAIITYQNSGREPAASFYTAWAVKLYSLADWNNGAATKDIMTFSSECLKVTNLPPGLQVVYPNTGFGSYQISFDTEKQAEANKIIVTDDIISGKSIVAVKGCFTYKSLKEFHHSAFCFYYLANMTVLPNLSICNVGNDAD